MFGNKGQGAMEYLMTYGWAILVVMIVGIVMWQLGIFSLGPRTITSTGFSKIKPQIAGSGLGADGTFVGVFTNGVGTSVNLNSVTINNTVGGTATTCTVTNPGAMNPIPVGENFAVTAANCGTSARGDIYTMTVAINYDVTIGTVTTTHTDSGTIRGPVE